MNIIGANSYIPQKTTEYMCLFFHYYYYHKILYCLDINEKNSDMKSVVQNLA